MVDATSADRLPSQTRFALTATKLTRNSTACACGCFVTTSQLDGDACSGCLDIDVVNSLPTQLWAELDPDIFANRKLPAMKRLADVLDRRTQIRTWCLRRPIRHAT